VHDCFSAAAILAADGAFLLGVMGPHTFNAGKIYFPCGTPDPADIVGDKVDLELSAGRELKEETGLDITEFASEPGWTMVADGPLIAQIKVLRSKESSAALRERILTHLGREQNPELADIRIIREHKDLDPAMPRFVTASIVPPNFGCPITTRMTVKALPKTRAKPRRCSPRAFNCSSSYRRRCTLTTAGPCSSSCRPWMLPAKTA
jgi:8-oxo-dGTP pyrophosphatase MutT (NUDIX family)